MATVLSSREPGLGLGANPEPSMSSHPYTCNTCQVAFRNSELQKGHMRSDWHRYNLKRRVTSLPPITSEVFNEKVLAAQASNAAAATKAAYERTCTACGKTYFSENAYNNHVGSQKHRARVLSLREDSNGVRDSEASSTMSSTIEIESAISESQDIDSDAEEEFNEVVEGLKGASITDGGPITKRPSRPHHSAENEAMFQKRTVASDTSISENSASTPSTEALLRRCLFCNYESPTIPLNVVHMERIHGMFIPERQYLVDVNGLLSYLREKINVYQECLYCGKLKPTVFGLQTHMRDKGHCKIRFDTEEEQLEIGDFYDFRSTYSDIEEEDEEMARSGGTERENGEDEDMEDADGWETDSSASSLDSADLTAVPLDQHYHQYEKLDRHPHHSSQDPRPHRNRDGFHSHAHKHAHAVFYSDYELYLPSGKSVGHRSLNKYYRQNLHSHPSAEERQTRLAIEDGEESENEVKDRRVAVRGEADRGRALMRRAHGGMTGVTDQKKREVKAIEKRARKLEQQEKRRFQWAANKKANSQKHFRDPLLQ